VKITITQSVILIEKVEKRGKNTPKKVLLTLVVPVLMYF